MAMVSIGYQADIESLTGDDLARETAPRTRKALGELFFNGTWGQSVI